jgi:hypothetical protein
MVEMGGEKPKTEGSGGGRVREREKRNEMNNTSEPGEMRQGI